MQSQTSIRKCLQNSKNHDIRKIHQLTSYESNIQFDQFSSAKQVVKSIRDNKVDKICTQLTSQGSVITKVWENVLVCTKSNWLSVRDKMPANIYNFVNRYLNNSLPTLKNMLLWGTSTSMSCLDCGNSHSPSCNVRMREAFTPRTLHLETQFRSQSFSFLSSS